MTTNEKDFLHFLKTREFSPELVGKYDVPKIPGVKFKKTGQATPHRVQLLHQAREHGRQRERAGTFLSA